MDAGKSADAFDKSLLLHTVVLMSSDLDGERRVREPGPASLGAFLVGIGIGTDLTRRAWSR